ncbi:MAG TPA: hypothetical protein HA252_00860 [Candidatus Diapherotrites archaeon]|uniref:Uncharacterized protein n=1 Tax=Candidatus Iainarchaeum sp. TaxID=3101447 RepID=A0A7J4JE00_9ARCH|nr:hypothetical protein [Candidatus Diapherotrites archaeon]
MPGKLPRKSGPPPRAADEARRVLLRFAPLEAETLDQRLLRLREYIAARRRLLKRVSENTVSKVLRAEPSMAFARRLTPTQVIRQTLVPFAPKPGESEADRAARVAGLVEARKKLQTIFGVHYRQIGETIRGHPELSFARRPHGVYYGKPRTKPRYKTDFKRRSGVADRVHEILAPLAPPTRPESPEARTERLARVRGVITFLGLELGEKAVAREISQSPALAFARLYRSQSEEIRDRLLEVAFTNPRKISNAYRKLVTRFGLVNVNTVLRRYPETRFAASKVVVTSRTHGVPGGQVLSTRRKFALRTPADWRRAYPGMPSFKGEPLPTILRIGRRLAAVRDKGTAAVLARVRRLEETYGAQAISEALHAYPALESLTAYSDQASKHLRRFPIYRLTPSQRQDIVRYYKRYKSVPKLVSYFKDMGVRLRGHEVSLVLEVAGVTPVPLAVRRLEKKVARETAKAARTA